MSRRMSIGRLGSLSDEGDSESSSTRLDEIGPPVFTTRFISTLDRLLRKEDEPRNDRIRKVATFVLAAVLDVMLIVYAIFRFGFSTTPTLAAYLLTPTVIFACSLTIIALLRTKNVIYATIFAHSVALVYTFASPLIAIFSAGVGIVDANGGPQVYLFIVSPSLPAMVAFTLRGKQQILRYSFTLTSFIIVGTLWNPLGSDLTGVGPYFAITVVNMIVVTLCLAFFTDVAEQCTRLSEVATSRAVDAEATAKAERSANRAKSRFVSVMSHEIRNPLQAVLLQLEMLQSTNLTTVQEQYTSGIQRASTTLLSILNDILDVTKIESGAVALENVPVSLRDLLEVTVHSNAPAAANRGVLLLCYMAPEHDATVSIDPMRIRQILQNLVSNAIKFTEIGEVEVVLEPVLNDTVAEGSAALVSTRPTEWRLSVRDTGIGIGQADMDKLFREFSQVDETTTRMYGGTGLGLFICKELAELLGGGVSVESEPGHGSTFSATFVASPVEAEQDDSEAPVRITSSRIAWTVVLVAANDALQRILQSYAGFFFAGASSVTIVPVSRVSLAERQVAALLSKVTPPNRLLVVAHYPDCTTGLLSLLRPGRHQMMSVVMVAQQRGRLPLDRLDEWPRRVDVPISLRLFCSTLARAVMAVDETDSTMTTRTPTTEPRNLSDGTVLRGMRLPSSNEMEATSSEQAEQRPDHSTILIVDDFELIRSLVQQLVSRLGYNTLVAANGRDAVRLVRAHYDRISMVLMDCEMPVMDGFDATEAIRNLEEERGISQNQQVFICAMTANAMREDASKCFSRRMSGFLPKPVKASDLEVRLKKSARLPAERGIKPAGPLHTKPTIKSKPKPKQKKPRKKAQRACLPLN